MKRNHSMRRAVRGGALLALVVAGAIGLSHADGQAAAKPAAEPKFIGAAKCKLCHSDAHTGDQFGKWKESKHSHAFERLAAPEALKVGKEKGVDEPQKSERCVKCHVTGYGLPPERFAKGFPANDGVQCESCHGPGERHVKARMAAAAQAPETPKGAVPVRVELPEGEVVSAPPVTTCTTCHNADSPTFKPFCYKHRIREVGHDDPRKQRSADAYDAMKCDCPKPAGGG